MNLRETVKLRAVPETDALTRWEKWKFWFLSNRARFGGVAVALFAFLRIVLVFPGHTEFFDVLKALTDLLLGTSAVVAASGATKPDPEHFEKMHAVIRERSGQFPAYQRRAADHPGAPPMRGRRGPKK